MFSSVFLGECLPLSNPKFGSVKLSTDGMVTIGNFTCNTGYSLSGAPILTCRASGNWDFTEPTCGMRLCAHDYSNGNLCIVAFC